jgi:hypothetical protein
MAEAGPIMSQGNSSRASSANLNWPDDWSARVTGEVCSMCEAGRPDDDGYGVRIFAGRYADAYLQRARVQTGYTKVIWRGRHVVEPTELSDEESAEYWREVLLVARGALAPLPATEDELRDARQRRSAPAHSLGAALQARSRSRSAVPASCRRGWPSSYPRG